MAPKKSLKSDHIHRPVNSFVFFYQEEVDKLRVHDKDVVVSKSVKKEIGNRWKTLSSDAKAQYNEKARQSSLEYHQNKVELPPSLNASTLSRCTPVRFMKLIEKLDENQKNVIVGLGFGALLDIKFRKLYQGICAELVERFDPYSCTLKVHDKSVKCSPRDIELIMGLKNQGIEYELTSAFEEVVVTYCDGDGSPSLSLLEERLLESNETGDAFKVRITLFILGALLCPTTGLCISPSLLRVVKDVDSIKEVNWAKLVFDFLVEGIKRAKGNKSKGISGCLFFLMLFYVDVVGYSVMPFQRRYLPRISVWGEIEVKHVLESIKKLGGFDSDKVSILERGESSNGVAEKESPKCASRCGCEERCAILEKDVDSIKSTLQDLRNEVSSFSTMMIGMSDKMETFKDDIIDAIKSMRGESSKERMATDKGGPMVPPDDKAFSPCISTPYEGVPLFTPTKAGRTISVGVADIHTKGKSSSPCISPPREGITLPTPKEIDIPQPSLVVLTSMDYEATCALQTKEGNPKKKVKQHIDPEDAISITAAVKKNNVIGRETRVYLTRQRKPSKYQHSPFAIQVPKKRKVNDPHIVKIIPKGITHAVACTFEDEMLEILCYIFDESLDSSEILVDNGIEIGNRRGFLSLKDGQWIRGDVIDMVASKLTSEEKARDPKMRRWYLPTRFSQSILNNTATVMKCKKAYRMGEKYMSRLSWCETIYIPMNHGEKHWYLLIIYLKEGYALIVDSAPSKANHQIVESACQKVLDFCDVLFGDEIFHGDDIKFEFSVSSCPIETPIRSIRQSNGYDCGMYVIRLMQTRVAAKFIPAVSVGEPVRLGIALDLLNDNLNAEKQSVLLKAKNHVRTLKTTMDKGKGKRTK